MPTGQLYTTETIPLADLLDQMSRSGEATLLVPDLQRDFVWKPHQISLLIDSLLKGWPLGALLLWSVDPQQNALLSRGFYSRLDSVEPERSAQVQGRNPPQEFRMVLDGQQRLQALLMAFGGNSFGLRLYDWEWRTSLRDAESRGRKTQRWSQGVLCLDLDQYRDQYSSQFSSIDFSKCLTWTVMAGPSGTGGPGQRPSHDDPIPIAQHGTHIRLSDLWGMARPGQLDFLAAQQGCRTKWGLDTDDAQKLAQFVLALSDLHAMPVSTNRLHGKQEAERKGFPVEQYDAAVINIFVRLNRAGTPLTEDDITFTWIKSAWDRDAAGDTAARCFEQLQRDLKPYWAQVEVNLLVSVAATIWGFQAGGSLLGPRDLLDAEKVKPLGRWLSGHWARFTGGLTDCIKVLDSAGLHVGAEFGSSNALAVLAGWYFRFHLPQPDQAAQMQDHKAALRQDAARWIAASTWAGVWSSRTSEKLENYVKTLVNQPGVDPMDGWLRDLQKDATGFIDTLSAEKRSQVRGYLLALKLWNGLNPRRLEISRMALTFGSRAPKDEVDHSVAVKRWTQIGGDPDTIVIHEIGNCVLLHKSFNVSKSDKPFSEFLQRAHAPGYFGNVMALPDALLAPSNPAETERAIKERTAAIKEELKQWLWPARARAIAR